MGLFTEKTVIITGGGRTVLSDGGCGSIGYGIATAFAKEGANLVLTGRNKQKLEDAKEELERLYGVNVLPVQADVCAGSDNEATVNHVVDDAIKNSKGSMYSSITHRLLLQVSQSLNILQSSSILQYIQDFMPLSTI